MSLMVFFLLKGYAWVDGYIPIYIQEEWLGIMRAMDNLSQIIARVALLWLVGVL